MNKSFVNINMMHRKHFNETSAVSVQDAPVRILADCSASSVSAVERLHADAVSKLKLDDLNEDKQPR